MIDRLEELLAPMEEEEEPEDVLVLGLGAEVPISPIPEHRQEKAPEEDGAPAEAGGSEWRPDAGAALPERQDEASEADAARTDAARDGAAELLWDGLRSAVMGPNGSVALRRPGNGYVEMAESAGTAGKKAAAKELSAVMDTMTAAERGLEKLYQQTVQAGRPTAQPLPAGRTGQTVLTEGSGRSASLTVDELDRAVRRDSRRYDGGMTLF